MKKSAIILSLFALVFIISCGDDDGGLSVNNQITIGDQTYEITNGAFIDLGSDEEGLTSSGSFAIADAEIGFSPNGFSISTSNSIRIVVTLISGGSEGLTSGDYSVGDILNPSLNTFFVQLIEADGTTYTTESGTISISGTSPNFTISFNLDLPEDQKLTGGFAGEFATN